MWSRGDGEGPLLIQDGCEGTVAYGRRPRRGLLKALAWEPLFRANYPGLRPMKKPHTVTDTESHFLHPLPLCPSLQRPPLPFPCCLGHVALCKSCKRGKCGRLLEGKVPCPSFNRHQSELAVTRKTVFCPLCGTLVAEASIAEA